MYAKRIRWISFLGLLAICFSGCFMEDSLKTPYQPKGPTDILSIYLYDSTYAFKEKMDTVNSTNACFRCFKPGTIWTFYYYSMRIGSESHNGFGDTIEVVLDSNSAGKQYFSTTRNGVNYGSFVFDSSCKSFDSTDSCKLNQFFPFYPFESFGSKTFELNNGTGGYLGQMRDCYTSDLGLILKEIDGSTQSSNCTYLLLLKFNNQPVNVGYVLREIIYKAEKPVR